VSLRGTQFSHIPRCWGSISTGGRQYVNIYPYGKWDFEDAGEALLWGSLSGVPGDQFFGANTGGSV
jgi:hypothetical protein